MKALIAMSGGVDSSAAAIIMKNNGYECVGCTMKLHNPTFLESKNDSFAEYIEDYTSPDLYDARTNCDRLGIEHLTLSYEKEFKENIIDYFTESYHNGRTPNPCVLCNKCMKFGKLLEVAKENGLDYVATGHYAIIEQANDGKFVLKKARDLSKDQSYFLYTLSQEELSHIKFPLGEYTKNEARELAGEYGFCNAQKSDSQDICFVPDGDYAKVIEAYSDKTSEPGNFVDEEKNVLGGHMGIIHYTIGQRKGLGIAFGKPKYVMRIDFANNEVVLGDNEDLMKSSLEASNFNWMSGVIPDSPVSCKARIRYRHTEQSAVAKVLENGRVVVTFDEPQRAITPGQSVVLYDGDTVLGGGIIELSY